jgi:uncharacterized protein (TIGR02453 family)
VARRNPFGPGLLRFLRELEANNKREWFTAHKERYEHEVREPALELIRAFSPHLKKISPYLVANDRKVGGSLMRVHRDVRFSKSKLPYKTNVGIQFRHVDGKDVHAPGLYFHVDPTSVFIGAGMWHPEAGALDAVRAAIDRDPKGWKRVRDAKRFREVWNLAGDSLKRAPRGYPADHPMVEDLKRKDHIAITSLRKSDVTRDDLIGHLAGLYGRAKGYMAWQAKALGLPF